MDVRKSLQLPEPRYAFFATIISEGRASLFLSRNTSLTGRSGLSIGLEDSARRNLTKYFDLRGIGDPCLLLLLFGAFAEEIVFRGVLLARLLKRYGTERGILLTGLIWAGYPFVRTTIQGSQQAGCSGG